MPKLIVAADCHLAPHAWADRPTLAGDAQFSFEQICQAAEPGDRILLLGDILDCAQPDPRTLLAAQAALAGKQVSFITGNHDHHQRGRWLELFPTAECLHQRTLEWEGEVLYGLNYGPRSMIQHWLQEIPARATILLAHQCWTELCHRGAQCSIKDVPHVRQIWSGDFHHYRDVTGTGKTGQPVRLLSPGATALQDKSEPPEKQFFIWENGQMRTVPLLTRPVYEMDVCTPEELAVLLAWDPEPVPGLPDHLQQPLLRLNLDVSMLEHRNMIEKRCDGRLHLFTELINRPGARVSRLVTVRSTSLCDAAGELLAQGTPGRDIVMRLLAAEKSGKTVKSLLQDMQPAGVFRTCGKQQ